MKLSSQQIQALAKKIATQTKGTPFSNPLVIREIITMLNEQRPCYSEIEFLGKGGFALVLKAKNSSGYVALKIVEFDESKKKAIEAVQREYGVLKSLQTSEYIIKLYDSFFLTEEQEQNDEGSAEVGNEEEEQKKSKELESGSIVNRYFVQETELCQGNLGDYLGFLRKKSIVLEERVKYIMVAQMLDAVNFLHMKNIVHRDIKPQNFLFQEKDGLIILKLCDFGFASPLDLQNSKSFLTGMGTPGYIAPEVEQGQSRKESDNFALGIIIIEIDNSTTFEYSKVTTQEFVHLQDGHGIFPKHNLNTTSVLYQMATTLLQPRYQDRSTAQKVLLNLLKQQDNSLKSIPIYSIILGNQLSLLPFSIPQLKNKNSQQLEKLKSISISLHPSEEDTKKKIDSLVEAYQKSDNTNSLSEIQAEGALRALFKLGDYDNLQLLGAGSQGLIIGGLNKKQQRQSALKICLCKNKAEIFRQIAILKKCQMPRIVQFYGYQFIQDENDNEYVIFEMEQCKSSLKQYLDEQCLNNKSYSPELKMELAIQMIASVNYLHQIDVLHRDIKLDNYLIQEDENGEIVVKLTDFDQAAQLEENYSWKLNNENHDDQLLPPYNCAIFLDKLGTFPYYAPERFNPLLPTTTKTDAYSVGLCLLVLDNYLTFSEDKLVQKYFTLIQPYPEPFFGCEEVIIDRQSKIYSIANKLLAYLPDYRSTLSKIMQDSQIIGQVYSKNSKYSLNQKSEEQICYFKLAKTQQKINFDLIINQISKITNLSSLSLDLESNSIGESGVKYLSAALIKLINLSSLSLNLRSNSIGDSGVNYLFNALIKLNNLSSLSLYLFDNKIGESGVNYLSTALIKLINLSSLSLDLRSNSLGDSGVKNLSTSLIKLTNLSCLSLDLSRNSIGESDVNYLSFALIKLINLSSLSLYLYDNKIGESGVKYISTGLIKLINLSSLQLYLWNNSIKDSGIKYLSTALIKLVNLSSLSLYLWNNSIGDEGVNHLSTALIKLVNLSSLSLDLSSNLIGESGGHYLSTALIKLVNLSSLSLYLWDNSIGDQGVNYLSTALIKLINLSSLSLYLWNNKIGDSGVNYLSTALIELINLSSLILLLSNNTIGDSCVNNLSTTLIKLINLSTLSLDLRHNSIGESGVSQLSTTRKNLNLKNKSIEF